MSIALNTFENQINFVDAYFKEEKRLEAELLKNSLLTKIPETVVREENPILTYRAKKFQEEIESLDSSVTWISINQEITCRIDQTTFSIVNASKTSQTFHQRAFFTEEDPLDGTLTCREATKLIKTYKHNQKENLLKLLPEAIARNEEISFYYMSLPKYFEMQEILENDSQNNPERYLVPGEVTGMEAALLYSLMGIFDPIKKYSKEGFILFKTQQYESLKKNFIKDLSQNGVEKLSRNCLTLIKKNKNLLSLNAGSQDDYKLLYATYLDLQQKQISISQALPKKFNLHCKDLTVHFGNVTIVEDLKKPCQIELEEEKVKKTQKLYFGTQNEIYYRKISDSKKAFQQIGCNPFDSVNRLLGWAQKNSKKLNKAKYQRFFHASLFQFQRLETVVKNQPAFISRLTEFFEFAMQEAFQEQNHSKFTFLREEMNKVHCYLKELGFELSKPKVDHINFQEEKKLLIQQNIIEAKDCLCRFENESVIIESKDKKRTTLKGNFDKNSGTLDVQEVERNGLTKCHESLISEELLNYFKNFKGIEFWKNGKTIKRIILEDEKISFSAKDDQIFCDKYPGFYIAEKNTAFTYPHVTLINRKDVKYLLKTPVGDWAEVDSIDGKLQGVNRFSQLALLFHFVEKKQYELASDVLRKISRTSNLNTHERSILDLILKNTTDDPLALSIHLKASLILHETETVPLTSTAKKPKPNVKFKDEYIAYLSQKNCMCMPELTFDEENQIINASIQELKQTTYCSGFYFWDRFIHKRYLTFFRERLQSLTTSCKASINSTQLPKKSPHIPISFHEAFGFQWINVYFDTLKTTREAFYNHAACWWNSTSTLKSLKEKSILLNKSFTLTERDLSFTQLFQSILTYNFSLNKSENYIEKIKLNLAHSSNAIQKRFEKENLNLEEFYSSLPDAAQYQFKYPLGALDSLIKEIKKISEKETLKIKTQFLYLQKKVNQNDEDLFKLFASATLHEFQFKTSLEKPEEFLIALTDHYICFSRLQQLNRVVDQFEKAKNVQGIEQSAILNEAAKILNAQPAYLRGTSLRERILLAQEISSGVLLRKDQIDAVDRIFIEEEKNRDILLEAPLGWGKSAFLRPLLNALKQNAFIVNLFPTNQEDHLSEQLEKQMTTLGKKITRLLVNRESKFTLEQLKWILKRMKDNVKFKRNEAVRPETYQSLELQMLSHCYHKNDFKSETEFYEILKVYLNILRLIRVQGWALIEEENEIINHKNRLIYALGDVSHYSSRYIRCARQLFECILQDEELKNIFKLKENNEEFITPVEIQTTVLTKVSAYFAKLFQFEEKDKTLFIQFLSSPKDQIEFNKSFEWAEKQENRDLLAYLKGLIHACLPIACKGKINSKDGYGLSLLPGEFKVPIPFSAKGCPKGTSQFYPDIALLRAFFYYLAVGLNQDDIAKLTKHMNQKAKTETSNDPAILTREQAILYYVEHLIASRIEIFPTTLESTSQNLRSMFAKTISTSATPQSAFSHGPRTKFIPMRGTAGSISHLLLTKSGSNLSMLASENMLEESANDIAETSCSAIVESSPFFYGLTNKQIASTLAHKLKDKNKFKGILFCDETDEKFKVLDFQSGHLKLLHESNHEEENLFKYYSQEISYNTNWKSAITAYFKITIGPNSTWEQVGQGAGRARLTHLMQTIGFEFQKETLNKHFQGKNQLSPMEILHFLLSNSAIQEASHIFLSLPDQMDNEIRRTVLDSMYGLDGHPSRKINPQKAWRTFQGCQNVFIKNNSYDPWENYGKYRKEQDPIDWLTTYQAACLHKIKKLSISRSQKSVLNKEILSFSKKWKEDSEILLPEKVSTAPQELHNHVEVIQEVTEEKQIEPLKITPLPRFLYEVDTYPRNYNIFIPGWEIPSRLRHTAFKVMSAVLLFFEKSLIAISKLNPYIYTSGYAGMLASLTLIEAAPVAATITLFTCLTTLLTNATLQLTSALGYWTAKLLRICLINFKVTHDTHYVKDIVHMYAKTEKADCLFDESYIITNNKLKLWPGKITNDSQLPFNTDAKPLLHILVIMDTINGAEKLTFVDGDQNDVQIWMRQIMEDNETTRTRHCAIYDLEAEDAKDPNARFTIVSKGTEISKILAHPKFYHGISQAKIYNGYLNFKESEIDKIPRAHVKILQKFLLNDVLKLKNKKKYLNLPIFSL